MLSRASRLSTRARAVPQLRTLTTSAEPVKAAGSRLKSRLVSSALTLGTLGFIYYASDANAGFHRFVALPAILAYTQDDPEWAHRKAVEFLGSGLAPVDRAVDDEVLAVELFGRKYSNPLGIAAGFDKHAEAIDGLYRLGFGYVEIGSVTPEPQDGNPKPRVFRLPESKSVLNRYGFNSDGHDAVLARLRRRVVNYVKSIGPALPSSLFPPASKLANPSHDVVAALLDSPAGSAAQVVDSIGASRSLREGRVLGVNLGKNKISEADSIDDFVVGVERLGPYADVLVINVSSPNTPGLRGLQRKGVLEELLEGVVAARDALPGQVKPPVFVKIAPDNDVAALSDIAKAVISSKVDGIVVSNTTISRPVSAGNPRVLAEAGGLSGPPVKPLALEALATLYKQTEGKVPLIGCGGISTGQDALDFAKAGASLVQLYTGFVYGGVGLPRQIKNELTQLLHNEGKTWSQVVGKGGYSPVATNSPSSDVAAGAAAAVAKDKAPTATVETHSDKPKDDKPLRAVPRLSDAQFEKELGEAKDQLEFLLKQLDVAAEKEAANISVGAAHAAVEPALPTNIDHSPLAIPPQAVLDEKAVLSMLDPGKSHVEAGIAEPVPTKIDLNKVEEVKEEAKKPSITEGKRWV